MSMQFWTASGEETLDLNNGLASRILVAMGLPSPEVTHGSMPVAEAKSRLAAVSGLSDDDMGYVEALREIVEELESEGKDLLEWS